jgi:hypothetical protein
MTTAVATTNNQVQVPADLQEKALLGGDLSKLSSSERLSFYNSVCTSLGLNPLTRPFEYIQLNGKLTLYARKDCTEQLRSNRHISIEIASREIVDGVYVVRAKATQTAVSQLQQYSVPRTDESLGAVAITGLNGEAKANAMMKAETKAKRRVTLSICGLGMLDETEIETIPGAKVVADHLPGSAKNPIYDPTQSLNAPIAKPENGPVTQLPPAAVAPPQAQDSSGPYIVKIGRQKNMPVTQLSDENLSWVLGYYLDKIRDMPNSKFMDEWETAVMALQEEKDKRTDFNREAEDAMPQM